VTKRRRIRWVIPIGVAVCYALLTLAVHLRMLDTLDIAVRRATHTGEVWGPVQIRAAHVVDALQPAHLAVPLLLVVAIVSLLRRSLRPFAVLAVVGGVVITVTLGTKWLMAHSDPGIFPVGHGSFPSGHTVSAIVAFGLAVLLLRPRTRWGWLLPACVGCLMGWAVVLAAVHPATDVVGAGLLAIAALASARALGLGQWAACERRTKKVG
jgi:membrane-associated phospholipid phosphatase